MKVHSILAATAVAGLAASVALGNESKSYDQVFSEPLPWNDGATDVPGINRYEIFVPDSGSIKSFKNLYIDFAHTWVGDLQITLTHKDSGTTVSLLDRPGFPDSTFGVNVDLDGLYQFQDDANQTLQQAAIDAGNAGETFLPGGTFAGLESLSAFEGLDKAGVWSLNITDNAGGDTGALRAWGFTVNNVPAPGALALLGIAGLTGARRRRG